MACSGNPIAEFLVQHSVKDLLYCGESEAEILNLLQQTQITVRHCSSSQIHSLNSRFEFALLYDCLEHLTKPEGARVIGHLRNAISPRIWLVGSGGDQWQFGDYIALGFKCFKPLTLHNKKLPNYFYDLGTYNKKRDWNNPKYWANPENWNKFRW